MGHELRKHGNDKRMTVRSHFGMGVLRAWSWGIIYVSAFPVILILAIIRKIRREEKTPDQETKTMKTIKKIYNVIDDERDVKKRQGKIKTVAPETKGV